MAVREGFHTVTPYLTAPDVDALVGFLVEALGAVETHREPGGSGGMHVELRVGDSMLMAGGKPGAPTTGMFYLYLDDPDAAYRRALGAGATSVLSPAVQPDGERRSGVCDAFGNRWYFGRPSAARAAGAPQGRAP
jgi:uncharacterized glyoxalase superfamily protein PhnB